MKDYKIMMNQEFDKEMSQCIDEFAEQVKAEFNKVREASLWTQIKRTLENVKGYTPLFCENGNIKCYKTSGYKPCILRSEKIVYIPVVVDDDKYILINRTDKSIELIEVTHDPFRDDKITEISDHVYYTSEGYRELFDKYLD